ncbi:MAG: VWA domain-containing protein [Deltaproteobacteria bacterium]|nr:VWA domain-containing protein [Deltaproteobacteria bacterium]
MTIKQKALGRAVPLAVVLLVCVVLIWMEAVAAQERKPLLIPGKRTLFQKVIVHPGAKLFSSPQASAQVVQDKVRTFSVLYVYDRVSENDQEWLEVGPSSNGQVIGWLEGAKASDWRQALTLVFTDRTGRQPVLFFKDRQSLEEVAAYSPSAETASQLVSEFKAIKAGDKPRPTDFPVVAMEPSEEAVPRDRFYLIPIFKATEPFEGVKFLQVASIDPGSAGLPPAQTLRTGIAFVIDTTISMRPYIERTRESVRKIYDAVEKAGLADKVAFGLVGFRSSIDKTPGLEYVAKVFSDLRDGRQRDEFEQALASLNEAKVSSHSFNEDAFAGLKTALQELNWAPFQSRLIFLISDAGAIRNDDPFSSTGMNEAQMADLAAAKGVRVFALHLKTPAGKKYNNHASAEEQYKTLTGQADPNIGHLYVPIDAGRQEVGVRGFGQVVEGVAAQMVELVRATAAGQRLELPQASSSGAGDVVEEAKRKAAILGYAMQLDFLGRRGGVQAPEVVTSWVSDMDLAQPDIPAFRVSVLLTKNQLSDLHQRLKLILDQAQRTKRTGAKDFFESILSAAAQTSRDPIHFSRRPNQNLKQLGFLGEFLDDLPYKSAIMRLTEEDWYRMSVGEQQAYVDDLKSKIKRYEEYHNDVENWESFEAANPGDSVYRVPLTMLP